MASHEATAIPRPIPETQACKPPALGEFHVAFICALPVEADPIIILLDRKYNASSDMKSRDDTNAYTIGSLRGHNVVIVHMPGPGITDASSVANQLKNTFKNISLCFVVGICGGVPAPSRTLGDVIIATEIVQTDKGKQYSDHFSRTDGIEGSMHQPDDEIRGFLKKLQTQELQETLQQKTEDTMMDPKSKLQHFKAPCLGSNKPVPYAADFRHKHYNRACETCDRCTTQQDAICDMALNSSCDELGCMAANPVAKYQTAQSSELSDSEFDENKEGRNDQGKENQSPRINVHFGRISSSNQVMKSGQHRDEISKKANVIAFEMESAGIWKALPTVVVKAVADYADSHKSKDWQSYSAAVAAACAKAVLEVWGSHLRSKPIDTASDDELPGSTGSVGTQAVHRQTFNGPVNY